LRITLSQNAPLARQLLISVWKSTTLTAPSISGLDFKPEVAKYLAYPESKMDEMSIFSADWEFINPIRSELLEKYNQVFGA